MHSTTAHYLRHAPLLFCCFLLCQCTGSPSGQNGERTASAGNTGNTGNTGNIRVLMVGGGASHDFDLWYKQADAKTLQAEGLATVRYTSNTDSIAYYLPGTDVLYMSNNQPVDDPAVRQAIFDFVNAGNGLVLGHAALWYNWADWPEYNVKLVGGGSRGHDPYGTFHVKVTHPDHPVMQGVDPGFTLKDELYYFTHDPAGAGIQVLATASADSAGESYPSVFIVDHKEARIAGIALGHDEASHGHPAYRKILRNAVKWAAKDKE